MKTIKYRRTSEIKMTNEARLLKELRLQSGLSIREVGRRLNRSECFVRHIEKGRLDVPEKKILRSILALYGVTYMQFKKRGETFKSSYIREEVMDKVKLMNEEKLKIVLEVMNGLGMN